MKKSLFLLLMCVHVVFAWGYTGGKDNQPADSVPQRIPIVDYTFKAKHLILPASLITVGALGHAIDGMKDYHLFTHNPPDQKLYVDDYLQWGLYGWTFVCDLMGKEKNHWIDQVFLTGLSVTLNAAMVHTVKRVVDIDRPNEVAHSFPSGHTANAFLGAHLAYKEFKDSNKWLAYSGYPLALFVAYARVHSNRHWVADVVAGAGFGILAVELSYLVYFPVRNAIARKINLKENHKLVVSPVLNPQGGGIYFSYSF